MKCFVAGREVSPSAIAVCEPRWLHRIVAPEVRYEIRVSMVDLRAEFTRYYERWRDELRAFPDPLDDVRAELRALDWPTLPKLAERDRGAFAVVLLALGHEVLRHIARGQPDAAAHEYAPRSVDEVELRGEEIALRGDAVAVVCSSRTLH